MVVRFALRNERGTSAVELALVLSLLVLVLFGIIQFGIAYNRVQGLHAAVREGARLASVGGTHVEIRDRVRSAQSLFDASDVVVTTTPDAPSAPPCAIAGIGAMVTVTAQVDDPRYGIDIPLFGRRTIAYRAAGTFRCERAGA